MMRGFEKLFEINSNKQNLEITALEHFNNIKKKYKIMLELTLLTNMFLSKFFVKRRDTAKKVHEFII